MDVSQTAANPRADAPEEAPADVTIDIEALIRKHQQPVWRYLRVLGCDPSLADDLTQETFLAVLTRPFEDFSDHTTLKYLRTVARNLLISRHRREVRYQFQAQVEHIELIWDHWTKADSDDSVLTALRECFGKLREKARLALNLRFRDRATRKEIADAVDMTEHGAKNLMQRAKKALRDCVERRIK